MLWLLLVTQPADAAPLVVTGANADRNLACAAGQEVRIQGSRLQITLKGDCGKISVQGNNNQVSVDGLSRAVLEGNSNELTYRRNLADADALPTQKLGIRNKVVRARD